MAVARVLMAVGVVQLLAGIGLVVGAPALCAGASSGFVVGGFCEAGIVIIGALVAVFGVPQLVAGWALGRAHAWGRSAAVMTTALFGLLYALVLAGGLGWMVTDGPGMASVLVATIGLFGVASYTTLWVRARAAS